MSDIDIPEVKDRRLNRIVVTTVVMLSVAMAVGKIKDDNIVQAMQADQARRIDSWTQYQATQIKAHDQAIGAAARSIPHRRDTRRRRECGECALSGRGKGDQGAGARR